MNMSILSNKMLPNSLKTSLPRTWLEKMDSPTPFPPSDYKSNFGKGPKCGHAHF